MKKILIWILNWIYLGFLSGIATLLLFGLIWLNSYLITFLGITTETGLWLFEGIYIFLAFMFIKKVIFGKLANYAYEANNPGEASLIFFIIFACVRVGGAIYTNETNFDVYNDLIKAPSQAFVGINYLLLIIASWLGVIFNIRVAQIAYIRDKEDREAKVKETVDEYIKNKKVIVEDKEEEEDEENPYDYEERIADLLERKGFINIDITPRRESYGADLIAEYNDKKVCVQCIMNNSKTLVEIKSVQEIYTAKHFYDCDYAFIYTTSDYTEEAEELAEKLGVKLMIYK